jgi:GAF domain-containing protein
MPSHLSQVLEMIARRAPLDDTLNAIVELVESRWTDGIAALMVVEDDQTLRVGAGPRLPFGYVSGIAGMPIAPSAGSCGTAAFRREPVFAADIGRDEAWANYRDLARDHGFSASWSVPVITSADRLVGTLALYFPKPRAPRPGEVNFANDESLLAAIAIEKSQIDDVAHERDRAVSEALERRAYELHRALRSIQAALEAITTTLGDASPIERECAAIHREAINIARVSQALTDTPSAAVREHRLAEDADV